MISRISTCVRFFTVTCGTTSFHLVVARCSLLICQQHLVRITVSIRVSRWPSSRYDRFSCVHVHAYILHVLVTVQRNALRMVHSVTDYRVRVHPNCTSYRVFCCTINNKCTFSCMSEPRGGATVIAKKKVFAGVGSFTTLSLHLLFFWDKQYKIAHEHSYTQQ